MAQPLGAASWRVETNWTARKGLGALRHPTVHRAWVPTSDGRLTGPDHARRHSVAAAHAANQLPHVVHEPAMMRINPWQDSRKHSHKCRELSRATKTLPSLLLSVQLPRNHADAPSDRRRTASGVTSLLRVPPRHQPLLRRRPRAQSQELRRRLRETTCRRRKLTAEPETDEIGGGGSIGVRNQPRQQITTA
jgi:hypothetical protein